MKDQRRKNRAQRTLATSLRKFLEKAEDERGKTYNITNIFYPSK